MISTVILSITIFLTSIFNMLTGKKLSCCKKEVEIVELKQPPQKDYWFSQQIIDGREVDDRPVLNDRPVLKPILKYNNSSIF